MKGGSLSRVTSRPFTYPMSPPAKKPMAMAAGAGTPTCTASLPMIMLDSTMMAPIERSMPAVRMMMVCAIAPMPIGVICFRIVDRLLGWKILPSVVMPNRSTEMMRTKIGTETG